MTPASIALAEALAAQPKPNKYRNKPIVVDGRRFDSHREAKRYGELKLLQRAGEIEGLRLQHTFDLIVNGVKICSYRSDFDYVRAGRVVVEDAKGVRTPVYILKRNLMRALHNIEIVEV